MTVRNLERLLRPSSVAVIGATDRPQSVGATVMRNLLAGGFHGPVTPVNPKHVSVAGIPAVADIAALDHVPDLAVICTPPQTVPGIIRQLGEKGTRAAVVLTAGLARQTDTRGRPLAQAMLEEARPHLLRILGPNCVGLLAPPIGLNASFAGTGAKPGTLAFVSQSGALTTAMLDWADARGVGFSHFISLGDSADVDFGDLLDYLATDPGTSAILLYIESITHARKFMSAARAAARNKPVIAVKSGRVPEGARAAASHTGALAGSDDVYEAAIRRAGMLRVGTTSELFAAAETLALARPFTGDRLAILTNGGGPGVMATDALVLGGGKLAEIDESVLHTLDTLLPVTWSRGNPVDIIGDAPSERYAGTLAALLDNSRSDAVLLIHAPTAIVASEEIAAACVPVARGSSRNVLSCWLGGNSVEKARQIFRQAGMPAYDTPEDGVRAFLNMIEFRRNQELLTEVPPAIDPDFLPDTAAARALVRGVLGTGRQMLTETEAKQILRAYGVPVVETRIADSAEGAVRLAEATGYPVALKILSPDITHKSDIGGVALDLESAQAVRDAAQGIKDRLQRLQPKARFEGFTVQSMVRRPAARELIVGIATDATFGPVILFGQGGIAVEVIGDRAVALPPLNAVLARDLIGRTRVASLLAAHRGQPPADQDALCRTLVAIAQIAADLPEIAELDVNPLLVDAEGVIALDARIRIVPAAGPGTTRFAIRPYPGQLEEMARVGDQPARLRPIRPEDEPHLKNLIAQCRKEDIYFRFFGAMRELPHSQLARFTQIDYEREMAFVACDMKNEILGEVRTVTDPDNSQAEFAILVRPDCQGKGLGHALLGKMLRYCRDRGTTRILGDVLASNSRMLDLARSLGFAPQPNRDGIVQVSLDLQDATCNINRQEGALQ